MEGSQGRGVVSAVAAAVFVAASLACGGQAPGSRAQSTPTHVIGAMELTSPASDREIWSGTITSQTSRHFASGSQMEDCETDWITDLDLAVDSGGGVKGAGESRLSAPRTCSPAANIVDNVQGETIDVQGRKEADRFILTLTPTGFDPAGTGDFGGIALLYMDGTCPGTPQQISVPLRDAKTAETQLNLSATMTGCGGSASDTMSNQSLIKLEYLFRCGELPASDADKTVKELCR